MVGIAFTSTQTSGVTTTFVTVVDIRWQPHVSADIRIGYYVDETGFLAGNTPVHTEYVALNILLIDSTLAIPPQIFSQLTAGGAILDGGTLV